MSLARKLGPLDATMIVVSGIIGSGIFINPNVVAQQVETPFLILAVWVLGGAIALCGAFVFAELGTVLPRAGGQYAFLTNAAIGSAIIALGVPVYFAWQRWFAPRPAAAE